LKRNLGGSIRTCRRSSSQYQLPSGPFTTSVVSADDETEMIIGSEPAL
jgi:hypothetical protein